MPQCSCTTKKGERCKNPTKGKSLYCHVHLQCDNPFETQKIRDILALTTAATPTITAPAIPAVAREPIIKMPLPLAQRSLRIQAASDKIFAVSPRKVSQASPIKAKEKTYIIPRDNRYVETPIKPKISKKIKNDGKPIPREFFPHVVGSKRGKAELYGPNLLYLKEALDTGLYNPNLMVRSDANGYFSPLLMITEYFPHKEALDYIELLLKYGAEPNYIGEKMKQSVVEYAASLGELDTLDLLLSYSNVPPSGAALILALDSWPDGGVTKMDVINTLLDYGAAVNARESWDTSIGKGRNFITELKKLIDAYKEGERSGKLPESLKTSLREYEELYDKLQ